MGKLVGFGESHLNTIRRALRSAPDPQITTIFLRDYQPRGAPTPPGGVGPAYLQAVRDAASDPETSLIFLSHAGGLHVSRGLFNAPRRFDFIVPEAEAAGSAQAGLLQTILPGEPEIIPYGMVRQMVAQSTYSLHRTLSFMVGLGACRHVCVLPPPPIGDPAFLDRVCRANAPAMLDEFGLSPPGLVYKLWHTLLRIMREACREHGVLPLDPPDQAVGPDGHLLPSYYGGDQLHANEAYGHLVLAQLRAIDAIQD